MEKIKIAFFDTKPYDKKSFTAVNEDFGYEIKYFKLALNIIAVKQKNSPLPSATKGYYGFGASINIDEFFKKKKSKK